MIDTDREDFKLLFDMKVLPLRELLIEQNLYDTKLSLINSLDKISRSFIRSLLELLLTDFYFVASMRQVLNEMIWAATLKRHTLEGDKKKKVVS